MKLHTQTAQWFVPDGAALDEAVGRTTHLAVGAHQDDLEIMAGDGILRCFGQPDGWFAGVVVTDGAGSPRNGPYASYTDEEMRRVRRAEQNKAACVGEYAVMAQLGYSSGDVKDARNPHIADDILEILKAARPQVVYTHNLADKHPTHVSVALRTVAAIRRLPEQSRPQKLYGCEVWRGLDWMPDGQKVVFDLETHPNLSAALVSVFDSQICGGKRYDMATQGRQVANATYADSHGVDILQAAGYAMDLTPLIVDPDLDIAGYVAGHIDAFARDVRDTLRELGS